MAMARMKPSRSRAVAVAITLWLRVRQDLLPDPEIVSAKDHCDLLVGDAALGEHFDEAVPMLVHGLHLDSRVRAGEVALHLFAGGIGLVVSQPADPDVLRPDQ